MKKTNTILLALTVFAIMLTQSCDNSSRVDKFLGNWERIDKPEKNNCNIRIMNDAIVAAIGKDSCVGLYDKNRDALRFYVFGEAGIVTYNKKTGHLLLNNGKDGEFKKMQ